MVYGQVVHFDFVGFDDELYVTKNFNVQKGFTVKGHKWAFTTFHSANWHPITWLSHMSDCEFYGLNPMGHHWTNIEFHINLYFYFVYIIQQFDNFSLVFNFKEWYEFCKN